LFSYIYSLCALADFYLSFFFKVSSKLSLGGSEFGGVISPSVNLNCLQEFVFGSLLTFDPDSFFLIDYFL